MSRSVSWRRLRTDAMAARIDEALQSTMYLVNQTGPTGFLIKQDSSEKKIKVLVGDPHTCSCSVYRKEKDLCVHILWVLLKKFRVPKENPIVHQLGLVEREISAVLRGQVTQTTVGVQQDSSSEELAAPRAGSCGQRPVSPDDVCPICMDQMVEKRQRLTYCRYGCGKTVHLKCLKVWGDHQRSQGQEIIECPLCRGNFCTFQELSKEIHNSSKPKLHRNTVHNGTTCCHCRINPIVGKCYRCTSCVNTFLCPACFKYNAHSHHSFEYKQHVNGHWRPAVRPLMSHLSQTMISDIQQREITHSDYDFLVQLDQLPPPSPPPQQEAILRRPSLQRLLSSLPAEPIDHHNLLVMCGVKCQVCSEVFKRGDWIRKLPCGHKAHRTCLDNWFVTEGPFCPMDGKDLQTLYANRGGPPRVKNPGETQNTSVRRGCLRSAVLHRSNVPVQPAPNMHVSGHNWNGLGATEQEHDNDRVPRLPQIRTSRKLSRRRPPTANAHGRRTKLPPVVTEFGVQATSVRPGTGIVKSNTLTLPKLEMDSTRVADRKPHILSNGVRPDVRLPTAKRISIPATTVLPTISEHPPAERKISGRRRTRITTERLPQLPVRNREVDVQRLLQITQMSLSGQVLNDMELEDV